MNVHPTHAPDRLRPATPVSPGAGQWRGQAASVIEEIFSATSPQNWDDLLDLRSAILAGRDWNRALDLFLACKAKMEADNYLPFYRLRRLLSASLRLEGASLGEEPAARLSLQEILRTSHRSLDEVRRSVFRMKSGKDRHPLLPDHGTKLQIIQIKET